MPELKINEISIKAKVNAIKNAGNEIDTNVSSIPNVSQCSGIMISEYRNRMDRISKLLDSYKALLIRDTDDILTVKDKLKDMDTMIGKDLIKAGVIAASGPAAHRTPPAAHRTPHDIIRDIGKISTGADTSVAGAAAGTAGAAARTGGAAAGIAGGGYGGGGASWSSEKGGSGGGGSGGSRF